MVNIELLEAEINEVGIPKTVLAEKCGISRQTLDARLKSPHTLTADDAYNLAQALRIHEVDKLMRIFFAPKVEESFT
ncbi:MAG: helix-turn-helix domain-containing protein [Clostridiales bacterium]|nr:helix-turn-helix domain-containing protein [Clostridiales bacterium]MBQ1570961.1 helix-turn-helix domain-containing protein [Clostridiales bacterium]